MLRGRGVSLKAPVPAMHFWRSLAGTAYAIGSTLVVASLQYRGIVHSFGLGVWLFHDPVTAPSLVGTGLILLAGLSASFFRALAPAVIARDLPSRSTDS